MKLRLPERSHFIPISITTPTTKGLEGGASKALHARARLSGAALRKPGSEYAYIANPVQRYQIRTPHIRVFDSVIYTLYEPLPKLFNDIRPPSVQGRLKSTGNVIMDTLPYADIIECIKDARRNASLRNGTGRGIVHLLCVSRKVREGDRTDPVVI